MLMYSELGGFAHFPQGGVPAGWVDGEPVRKALMNAKNPPIAKPVETVTIQTVAPQDTPPRRLGRPPKIAEEI
jgi:hypothetical protein